MTGGGGGKGRRRGVGPIKYDVVALVLYTEESRELCNLFRSRVARGFSSRFSEDVTQFTSVSTVNGLCIEPSYMMKLRDYPLPSLALIFLIETRYNSRCRGCAVTSRSSTCSPSGCRRTAPTRDFRSTSNTPTIGGCKSNSPGPVTKAFTSAKSPSIRRASTPSGSSSQVFHCCAQLLYRSVRDSRENLNPPFDAMI